MKLDNYEARIYAVLLEISNGKPFKSIDLHTAYRVSTTTTTVLRANRLIAPSLNRMWVYSGPKDITESLVREGTKMIRDYHSEGEQRKKAGTTDKKRRRHTVMEAAPADMRAAKEVPYVPQRKPLKRSILWGLITWEA